MEIQIKGKSYKISWEFFIAPSIILLVVILLIVTNYSKIKEAWIDYSEEPTESVSPGLENDDLPKQPIDKEEQSPEPVQSSDPPKNDKVNINKAGVEELMTLPYIGEVKANAIKDYRTTYGPFKSIDELDNVKGIGPKTIERLRTFVIVE